MPLQTSGAISLSNIQSEFGGSNPISISEYVRGGSLVPDTPANSAIPTSLSNISFSDFYGSSSAPAGPPPAVRSNLESFGASGGRGITRYEIITGMICENSTRYTFEPGDYFFFFFADGEPTSGRLAGPPYEPYNTIYTNEIVQAQPGDKIFMRAHAYTSSTWPEYFEFYYYKLNGQSGWYRFANSGRVNVSPSGLYKDASFTIASDTPPGNYAIAIALSYSSLGATTYRSWRSYSLHIYDNRSIALLVNPGGGGLIR